MCFLALVFSECVFSPNAFLLSLFIVSLLSLRSLDHRREPNQAINRVFRMGQDRDCIAKRFVMRGTGAYARASDDRPVVFST
jgi:hypothetical protein